MAGTLTIDTLKASSGVLATQNGMTGIAKAWVNFAGGGSSATINSSFNVSSVTRNGTGDYSVNFTTVMPNAYYTVSGQTSVSTGTIGFFGYPWTTAPNVNSARLYIANYSLTQTDSTYNSFAFHSA